MTATPTQERRVYQVSELTRHIKRLLEIKVGVVWLEGEISNLSRPSSGHLYFTLKDNQAQIKAALFRGRQGGLSCAPRDGLRVRVYGQITVYERSGQYQLIVQQMEAAGEGALQAAFEALKKQLAEEGLFDPARKRPLPAWPRRIGLVTSPTGAAIRDMLNVLDRRFPGLHIILAPVPVQGDGAAEKIAAAIDQFNALNNVDVLIVGRGGGSLEDLWAFNEAVVARAIARSHLPVISAVGHEIDFAISDFVADLRAPTPSAAAELVIGRKADLEAALSDAARRLARALDTRRLKLKTRFVHCQQHWVFREPLNLLRQHRHTLAQHQRTLATALRSAVRERQQRIDETQVRARHLLQLTQTAARNRLTQSAHQLRLLGPLSVLARGYSITSNAQGRIVRHTGDVSAGELIETRLAQGRITSEVRQIVEEKTHDH